VRIDMRPYDERLDHLLARAAKVFAERGYHSTTMRDLAAASGMSLAGMYYYVKGKEELLSLIEERCFTRVLDGARRAIARHRGDRPAGAVQHASEAPLLDEGEQLLFALDVVVHPGERHAARRRQVPHGGGVIAPLGEDLRRPGEEMVEPLVVGTHVDSNDRSNLEARGRHEEIQGRTEADRDGQGRTVRQSRRLRSDAVRRRPP